MYFYQEYEIIKKLTVLLIPAVVMLTLISGQLTAQTNDGLITWWKFEKIVEAQRDFELVAILLLIKLFNNSM